MEVMLSFFATGVDIKQVEATTERQAVVRGQDRP